MKRRLGEAGKTNWLLIVGIIAGLVIVYFLFFSERLAEPITVRGTIEVRNTRQGETIKVGIYQYSGKGDTPLGDFISERIVYTCETSQSTETFSYEVRLYEEIRDNYFVVFVQACPDGWIVLDVRDGPVFTNVNLVRRWGEGVTL